MNDLISRAAAIEAILGSFNVIKAIEELYAVDAMPVICGKWVEEPDRVGHYHCSKCGVVWGIAAKAMKYCPNCAAKMTNSPIWDVEDAK